MLVIHWAKQSRTGSILKNWIHVGSRKLTEHGRPLAAPTPRGVYVYPYTRSRFARGRWRRVLKEAPWCRGNYNGFVFRLVEDDFPVLAGHWHGVHSDPAGHVVSSMAELARRYGGVFVPGGTRLAAMAPYFEIVIRRWIAPSRILRVIRDRAPVSKARRPVPSGE